MRDLARDRLNRLLRDEDYGPKLARLHGQDERKILDLIEANRGREARKELDRLDAARRKSRAVARRVQRYVKKPNRAGPNRPTDAETLFWQRYQRAMGYRR